MKNKLFIACGRECAQKLMGINHRGKNSPKYVEKIKNKCAFCGKEYEIYNDQIGINRYCSKECQGKDKTKQAKVILKCEYCKKEFEALKGTVSFWGTIKYCSDQCRKAARIKKAEMVCVICGKQYFVSNNRKDISLCCSRECLHEWLSSVYSERPEVKIRLRMQGTKSQINQPKEYTIPEQIVLKYLEDNHIDFFPQFPVGNSLIIDFLIPEFKCALEVYGDYWHGNPRKYGDGKKELSEMQIKNKKKDVRRYKVLTNKYHLYFYSLWEYDIKNDLENSMNKFLKYIKSKIRNE